MGVEEDLDCSKLGHAKLATTLCVEAVPQTMSWFIAVRNWPFVALGNSVALTLGVIGRVRHTCLCDDECDHSSSLQANWFEKTADGTCWTW